MCVCVHVHWLEGAGGLINRAVAVFELFFLVFSILDYFNKISLSGLHMSVMYFRTIASVMLPHTQQHAQTKNNTFQRF